MKKLFFFIVLFACLGSFAQPPGGRGGGGRPGGKMDPNKLPKGEIFGNIKDSLTGDALSYVTVLAFRQPANKQMGGAVTDENGNFTISDVPAGKYTLRISFVGYRQTFVNDVILKPGELTYMLKDFQLSPSVLKTVDVFGDTPEVTYEIDKKVVNVEDQQNTAGLTAVEVLENVPSVTVDSDGTVSLRGSSSFTLLIDGVPTVLDPNDALAMIPANTIKDIEIITNPSAKFDAEGTSGVINIITKKSKLEGMSALMNATAGRFHNYSGDASLNIKKKKFAFDLSGSYNQRSRPNDKTEVRTTTYDSVVNVLNSTGISDFKRQNWNVAAGFQWNPNSAHNMVIKSSYGNSVMQIIGYNEYENYDDDSLIDQFVTDARAYIPIRNISNSLFYQYNIKRDKNHYISFKGIANLKFVWQDDSTLTYDENDVLTAGNIYTEEGPSNLYRFNVDYQLPIKKFYRFQTGLQAQFGQSADIGRNYEYVDSLGTYELNELFSSDVEYTRDVHAAYVMFNGKVKKFGFQTGLRAEYTHRVITSTTAIDFTTINRLDFFPSAHLSYSFDNRAQILASYSRRIKRPRSWFFEPFITWNSPFSVRSGNPNLEPTYINNFETSFMQPLPKKKGFYSFEAYYRLNNNIVEWIQSVYQDGILISNPYNIGTSQSTGIEGMIDYRFTNWYKANLGFNTFYFDLKGSLNDVDYSTSSFNWSIRSRHTFDMKGWVMQLNARYNSGSVTAQGSRVGVFTTDLSLRKSFYKNKLSFNLQGRNILMTSRRESFSNTANVDIHSLSIPRAPFVSLTVSVKLNNYEKIYNREEQLDDF